LILNKETDFEPQLFVSGSGSIPESLFFRRNTMMYQ